MENVALSIAGNLRVLIFCHVLAVWGLHTLTYLCHTSRQVKQTEIWLRVYARLLR